MCVCHHTRHRVSVERAEFIMTLMCVCVLVCVCSCVKSDRVDIDRHEHSSLLMKHSAGSSHRTITELRGLLCISKVPALMDSLCV